MNNKPPIFDFLKQFSGWITGIMTLLTMLVGFAVLLRDNPQLMVVLVVVTSSIAGIMASVRIISEKTPPLVLGGKGLPKYPNLHSLSKLVLIAIPIFNLIFFSTRPGKDYVRVSLYGTETPISVNTVSASPIGQTIPTFQPTPFSLADSIDTGATWGCNGFNYVIPSDIDLSMSDFELANTFYTQKVWERDKWNEMLDFSPALKLRLTNTQPNGGKTIIVDNKIQVVVDSYEPLDFINIAQFTRDGSFLGHGGCGGGGESRTFSASSLVGPSNLVVNSNEYDYFTLQPGEYEEFYVPFECGEPGIYRFHLAIDTSYGNTQAEIIIKQSSYEPLVVYCPKSFSVRNYAEVETDFSTNIVTIHTITYSGKYILDNGAFIESTEGSTSTMPWTPCSDAPESYIFSVSRYGMINPENSSPINVRSSPELNSSIIAQGKPGQELLFEDGPVCADGVVWWSVSWAKDITTSQRQYGWVGEGDGKERWVIACPGSRITGNLETNSEGKVNSNDWCR